MPTSSSSRSGVRFGARVLVSQAYPPYIHHSTPNTSSTSSAPPGEKWCTSSEASWVRVNAKTRSKNSSSVLTRSGASGSVPAGLNGFCGAGRAGIWAGGAGGAVRTRAGRTGFRAGHAGAGAARAASAAMSRRNQPPRIRIRSAAW